MRVIENEDEVIKKRDEAIKREEEVIKESIEREKGPQTSIFFAL